MGPTRGRELQIGEPVTEFELERPAQEDCACKEGMFPTASRRQILPGHESKN